MTSRIPPKNGGIFRPGQVMRLEFPAQGLSQLTLGYINPTHTTIEFDVSLSYTGSGIADDEFMVRFQNNVKEY